MESTTAVASPLCMLVHIVELRPLSKSSQSCTPAVAQRLGPPIPKSAAEAPPAPPPPEPDRPPVPWGELPPPPEVPPVPDVPPVPVADVPPAPDVPPVPVAEVPPVPDVPPVPAVDAPPVPGSPPVPKVEAPPEPGAPPVFVAGAPPVFVPPVPGLEFTGPLAGLVEQAPARTRRTAETTRADETCVLDMTTMVPLPGYNVEGHSKKVIDEERRESAVSAPFAKPVAPPFWAVIWSRRRPGASPTPKRSPPQKPDTRCRLTDLAALARRCRSVRSPEF